MNGATIKTTKISNLMKIRPAEAALFHANRETHGREDRQTHDEANSRFSQFCKTA